MSVEAVESSFNPLTRIAFVKHVIEFAHGNHLFTALKLREVSRAWCETVEQYSQNFTSNNFLRVLARLVTSTSEEHHGDLTCNYMIVARILNKISRGRQYYEPLSPPFRLFWIIELLAKQRIPNHHANEPFFVRYQRLRSFSFADIFSRAVSNNVLQLVEVIISQEFGGLPLHVLDENDCVKPALRLACEAGHVEMIELLLKLGAHVDGAQHEREKWNSPLFHLCYEAANRGRIAAAECLLKHGASTKLGPQGKNPYKSNALAIALDCSGAGSSGTCEANLPIVEMLLKHPGTNREPDYDTGETMVTVAIKSRTHKVEKLRLLVQYGFDVHKSAPLSFDGKLGGWTPLQIAAQGSDADCVEELVVRCKVDPNAVGDHPERCAPLALAIVFGSKPESVRRMLTVLLDAGASTSFTDYPMPVDALRFDNAMDLAEGLGSEAEVALQFLRERFGGDQH